MSDAFTLDTSFLSFVAPTVSPFSPDGPTNQGFIKGLDDNHYVVTADNDGIDVLCAETGSLTRVTYTQFHADLSDFGISGSFVGNVIPISAPDTSYFYVMSSAPLTLQFDIAGVLYKVVADGTIQPVGAVSYRTSGLFGGLLSDTIYGTKTINNELYAVASMYPATPKLFRLPLTETVIIDGNDGSWDALLISVPLIEGFFDYAGNGRAGGTWATIIPLTSGRYGVIIYVGVADYAYMAAHPGHNAQWDALTGPCVLWFLSTDGAYTDVSTQFGLSDAGKHLDGSASTNEYDDYWSPNSFMINTRTYVMFARSYTLPADLEPVGTYVRGRIFLWDGTTATSAFDETSALFDPVVDCGVNESLRTDSYPQFVQGGYDAANNIIRYVWYGRSSVLDFNYVFGYWITVVPGTVEAVAVTFSELINPSFSDWQKADPQGLGADYQSELTTYYMFTDDTMLWMYAPYVYVYIQNTERSDAGLIMQPQWDWAEDASTSKFSRAIEVYREADQSLVAVSKNRIRGKGRALRLYFLSEQGKDFNLLGWGVDVQKNQRF